MSRANRDLFEPDVVPCTNVNWPPGRTFTCESSGTVVAAASCHPTWTIGSVLGLSGCTNPTITGHDPGVKPVTMFDVLLGVLHLLGSLCSLASGSADENLAARTRDRHGAPSVSRLDHPFSTNGTCGVLAEWVPHSDRGRPHAAVGPGLPDGSGRYTTRSEPRLSQAHRVTVRSLLGWSTHRVRP